jgi:hypothetical protein
MTFSGILHFVALVRTDVSEKCISFIIRLTRIGELGTPLAVTINRRSVLQLLVTVNVPISPILVPLMMEAKHSSETSFLKEQQGVKSQKAAYINSY